MIFYGNIKNTKGAITHRAQFKKKCSEQGVFTQYLELGSLSHPS